MVYRSSRRQAQRDEEPEFESLQVQEQSQHHASDLRLERLSHQVWLWRALALGVTAAAIVTVVVVVMTTWKPADTKTMPVCGRGERAIHEGIIDLSEPSSPGPFHDLTKVELRLLRSFLEADPNIRAVKPDGAEITDSNIYTMDLFPPPKKDVLNYLDNGDPQPPRQARVVMYRGDINPPMVEEHICGPLPDITSCHMLKSDKRRNPVEFSLRPDSLQEGDAIYDTVLAQVDKEIGYILRETYGTSFINCPDDRCLNIYLSSVATGLVNDISKRRLWIWADFPVEYYVLHPIDLGILTVLDGSDPSKFYCDKIWFHGHIYDSTLDLIARYNNTPPSQRWRYPMPDDSEDQFSSLNHRGVPMPNEPQRPPTLVEPDGKRYSMKDRQVKYLDWTFNFRMSALTGPALYDIRFRGERIVYELSLAEIAVFYSAHNPMHQVTDYVDSGLLLGTHAKSLVPGADCPEVSSFINVTFTGQAIADPVELTRAFCLFENNNGYPLRRHLSYSQDEGGFYGGMMDSVLTLRSAHTIVNYDYIVDFIFHQNGAIETRMMSTGYILPSFYSKLEDPYGFRLEESLTGNLHHHMFHFKADIDILGTSNRYETLDIIPETVNDFKSVPGRKYHQSRFKRSLKETEQDALYKYNFDTPKYHVVHNDAMKTKYGAMRGFRVGMHGMSKQLLQENESTEGAVPWARHQLVVTKFKDDELVSSSPYAMWDSKHPVTDFSTFYADNDNITDQDLVLWVSQGMHHIPHTEDLPLTPTPGNHLTFFILPYNYFDHCPSTGSRDHIRISHKDRKDPKQGVYVNRNGNSHAQCALPPLAQEYDQMLEDDPDLVLESREQMGIF